MVVCAPRARDIPSSVLQPMSISTGARSGGDCVYAYKGELEMKSPSIVGWKFRMLVKVVRVELRVVKGTGHTDGKNTDRRKLGKGG